jgi:hypothetical protein
MSAADRHYSLIVEAWRAATSTASLDECTSMLAKLLQPVLNPDSIALWRLSKDGNAIQPASFSGGDSASPGRRPVNAQSSARLRETAKSGRAKVAREMDRLIDLAAEKKTTPSRGARA